MSGYSTSSVRIQDRIKILTLSNSHIMFIQKVAMKSSVQDSIFPEPGEILRDDQKKVFKHYCGLIDQLLILENPTAPKIRLEGKHKKKLSLDVIKELTLYMRMVIAGLDNDNGYRKNKLRRDRCEFEKYKPHQRNDFFKVYKVELCLITLVTIVFYLILIQSYLLRNFFKNLLSRKQLNYIAKKFTRRLQAQLKRKRQ